ncbi:hypothetical protein [Enterocloster sp.]|uniref:hypothetical protein n=1 Tax=Enterocloster sp. TaxID=2719315 RepID=UPI00388E3FFE
MLLNNKFKGKSIVLALICAIVGILFMWRGNGVLQNIGSVLLISGIYTILDNMFLKESLVELVVKKVKLDKEIDDTGLIQIDSTLTNIDYKSYIEGSNKNIDIVHNYGRTWTTNNFDFIKNVIMNKECKVRVALLNPESCFVQALEEHYGYTEGQLKELIKEATEKWKALGRELAKKKENCRKRNSTYKNKKCGNLELYYFNGQPTDSIYRMDNKIIIVSAKNSREKSVYLPYYIFEDNGEKGLYYTYSNEIETIIKEAQKVEV